MSRKCGSFYLCVSLYLIGKRTVMIVNSKDYKIRFRKYLIFSLIINFKLILRLYKDLFYIYIRVK